MKTIEVCLSPQLLDQHNLNNKIVVVTDVFRATSSMVTGFAYGVHSIRPVASVEECQGYREHGYILAGERNAKKVEGFDLDNSPFSFMSESLIGERVAMSTTNGTLAISKSKANAVKVIIGAFLNLQAIIDYLRKQTYDVVVLCSGWKGRPNSEDTLFAGAVVEGLQEEFSIADDSPILAMGAYKQAKDDLISFMANSSHVRRLQSLGINKDIAYCLQRDLYDVVPILRGNELEVCQLKG